jgi:hypothetical protein
MRETDKALIEQYVHTDDRSGIWGMIDNTIRESRRSFPSDDPYRLVLRSERFPSQDTHVDLVFDAHRSELELVVDSPIASDGKVHFFHHELSPKQAGSSVLRYSTNHWQSAHEARAERVGERLVFRLPATGNEENLLLALRSANHRTWWKDGERDIAMALEPLRDASGITCVGEAIRDLVGP